MKIESYAFGRMVIDGRRYTRDLKILGNEVHPEWWRAQGHRLSAGDLEDVWRLRPAVLVVGCGAVGMMKLGEDVRQRARQEGIRLVVERTGRAVRRFNELRETEGELVAGAFHLTC